MRKTLYISFLFLAASIVVHAQKFSASPAQVEVAVGDAFQVQWDVDGNGAGLKLPQITDFDVLMGPMQSSSVNIVNGRMSESFSYIYRLRAKKAGTFKIPPAIIKTQKGTLQSNEITVKVTQGSAPKNQKNGKGEGTEGNGGAEYFIQASVDKGSVYEGEPVTVTYKLYLYKVDPQGVGFKKPPTFPGFWTKDLPDQTDKQLHVETKNGKQYYVAVVKKAILYPQKTGDLTIDPIEMEAALAMQAPKQKRNDLMDPFGNDPFFDRFFNQQIEVYKKELKSNSIILHVNDVPETGKPSSYSGLVGSFRIHANIDKTKLKENDALTYRVTVEGTGNLQQLQAFTLDLPPDWDVYDPKSSDGPGTKTFEYTIIPKKMGKYTIPAIDFSYFDINSRKYVTDKTKEYEITVEKGSGTPSGAGSGLSKEDVKLLGQDIQFIKTSTSGLQKEPKPFYGSFLFYILSILPIPLFAFLLLFRRKNEDRNADVMGSLRRKATGMARKRLKNAKVFKDKNDKEGFYNQVLLALYGYVQNKIGIQMAETSRTTISEELQKHGAKPEAIDEFMKLVDSCEYAKYAPSAVSSNLDEVYNHSVELISNLEEQLK